MVVALLLLLLLLLRVPPARPLALPERPRAAANKQHLARGPHQRDGGERMATLSFRNFDPEADVSGSTPCKTSAQRAMVQRILEQYPALSADTLELVLPKKAQCTLVKGKDGVVFVVSPVLKTPVFFQQRDGPFYPTLRFLHMAGDALPKLGIDKGGIKFILKGANVMCKGVTSPGGSIPTDLPAGTIVQVMAEGKELPLAIGVTALSTDDMKKLNAGTGIDIVHFLGDDLWRAHKAAW